jgi:hypothetical protein
MDNFQLNLALTLAHSSVVFARDFYSPNGIVNDAINGGDPAPQPVAESTRESLAAMTSALPGYGQAARSEMLPNELAKLNTAQQISPAYAAMINQLYGQYGPELNRIGQFIERDNRLASADADADILAGPGRRMTEEAQKLDEQLNKEFYDARRSGGKTLVDLLGSINLDRPDVEAERLIGRENARSGNLATPSATNTLANALQFGNEQMKRQGMAGNAVNAASNFMASSRSEFNPVVTALGRPSSNIADSRFPGVSNPGDQAFNMASDVWGGTTGLSMQRNQLEAQRRDSLDRINETMSSMPSVSCCFIFLEVYNGRLPWWVRAVRDRTTDETIRRGYKRMAKWLVPLMQRSELVKGLVNDLMVAPLTAHGGYVASVKGYEHGHIYTGYRNFWFKVWRMLGKY